MARPHPGDDGYVQAYGRAWSEDDPTTLFDFFAPDGVYTDVAMGTSWEGHDGLARFHRFMLRFAPDTRVEFLDGHAGDGWLYAPWAWSGSIASPLKLRDGSLVDLGSAEFRVHGVASCRFGADGRLIRHDDYWDVATLLHQAGVALR